MRFRSGLLSLALASLAACASTPVMDDTADIRLRVEPAAVRPGESVTLVLENRSTEELGYNLCTSRLEGRSGTTWQPVPEDRLCTMELRTLERGGDARITLSLASDLAPGEYRYVAGIERMASSARVSVTSRAFDVRR